LNYLDHWFWLLMVAAFVLWYLTITVYIAFRGARDIKSMLSAVGRRDPHTKD
jgi:hypothetical protein